MLAGPEAPTTSGFGRSVRLAFDERDVDVCSLPSRTTVTVISSPGEWSRIAAMTPALPSMADSSMATTTSPTSMPAPAAGESSSTS